MRSSDSDADSDAKETRRKGKSQWGSCMHFVFDCSSIKVPHAHAHLAFACRDNSSPNLLLQFAKTGKGKGSRANLQSLHRDLLCVDWIECTG